jgi:hypothetical protein
MLALAVIALCAPSASGQQPSTSGTRVVVAALPGDADLDALARVDGLAVGLLGTGIGLVPPEQTFLDISQGNRVSTSIYDGELPPLQPSVGQRIPESVWDEVVERADDASRRLIPGLLATTLEEAGIPLRASPETGEAALIAVDRDGGIDAAGCPIEACEGVVVTDASTAQLPALVEGLTGDDLLIAIQTPPPEGEFTVAVGVAGKGFQGELTSSSTRVDGLVISTDLAATILERLDVSVPDEMNGQELEVGGSIDAAALADTEGRLEVKSERRGPVLAISLLIWTLVALLLAVVLRGEARRRVAAIFGLSVVYLTLVQTLTPAIDPSQEAERAAVLIGSPVLAALTHRLVGGWRAFAVACTVTVGVLILDLIIGLELIQLSILGPNLIAGGRFFGLNNELEAIAGALVPLGVGAFLATLPETRRGGVQAAASFLVVGLVCTAIFAIGRLGADVGAAIVLPAGAAAAAAVALDSRRGALLVLLAPIAGLIALIVVDAVIGGDAHLTRTIVDAEDAGEVIEVIERKLTLVRKSFAREANLVVLPFALVLIVAGVVRWRSVKEWLSERSILAGFVGAAVATVVGTFTNDSGAVVLTFGTFCATAGVAYAWSLRKPLEQGG